MHFAKNDEGDQFKEYSPKEDYYLVEVVSVLFARNLDIKLKIQ